jgi:hypothetical protein
MSNKLDRYSTGVQLSPPRPMGTESHSIAASLKPARTGNKQFAKFLSQVYGYVTTYLVNSHALLPIPH